MTNKEIQEKILEIVSEKVAIPKENLKLSNSFSQDLNMDSLTRIDLIMALEDAFQLTIPDEEAEKVKTIEEAIQYISKELLKN